MSPTISSGALRKLLSLAVERGADPTRLLAAVQIDERTVADRDARVPLDRLHALWDAALVAAPMPAAATLLAGHYSPGDYGLVGFVAMNSETLGEGLGQVVRYSGLWADEPGIALAEDGTMAIVYRTRFEDGPGLRVATEAAATEILNGARLLTQQRVVPEDVRFTHDAPADLRPYEEFFGCRVRFGSKDTAMVLRRQDLALRLPKADAQLGAYLRTLANQAPRRDAREPPGPLDRMRQIIAEDLQKGIPSLEDVARRIGTSERTLRRRLDEQGTSFRAVLDETRAELAKRHVRDERLPLSEVAFLLGFSEPSAFHRAFKRWTGATPSQWRGPA